MKNSRHGEGSNRLQDYRSGAAFSAPVDANGTNQASLQGHIVVLPGGLVLVDMSLKLALGEAVPGSIECKNGRSS